MTCSQLSNTTRIERSATNRVMASTVASVAVSHTRNTPATVDATALGSFTVASSTKATPSG